MLGRRSNQLDSETESEAPSGASGAVHTTASLDPALALARHGLDTARALGEAMLAAVAEQQRAQRELLAETARLCQQLLSRSSGDQGAP
ncbi:MAG: RebB family R body protein [Myxococcales bacterium]|nr:RebB family R body protein [Myxococcales bacterium]